MFEDGGIIRRIKRKGEGYSNPNEGATVESECWSLVGQLEGSACPELIPGKELLAVHRVKVAGHPGGVQLDPSRGQMGWRVAGDGALSSPWLAPGVALPGLLLCRAEWKTLSPGKPWTI